MVRTDTWLRSRVERLWSLYFADSPQGLPIRVRFGSRALYRYGSIAQRKGASLITINGLMRYEEVPEWVVDSVLAHELVHYVQGFGSGLPKTVRYPHRGGVIQRELAQRDLADLEVRGDEWLATNWKAHFARYAPDILAAKQMRAESSGDVWRDWLDRPGLRTANHIATLSERLANNCGFTVTPFQVEWLHAGLRLRSMSTYAPKAGAVRLHGLLADRRVPDYVVDLQVLYWLGYTVAGSSPHAIFAWMKLVRPQFDGAKPDRWARTTWPKFLEREHPLRRLRVVQK